MTFAVCIAPDNIMCLNFTYGTGASVLSADGNISLIHYDGDRLYIRFISTGNNWIGVKWAALYEGTYTADTLPPYVPKGYAAELAECQRYFQLLNEATVRTGGSASAGQLFFELPIPMRTMPSATIVNGGLILSDTDNQAVATITSMSSPSPHKSGFMGIVPGKDFSVSTWYTGYPWVNGLIQLSADL